MAYVIITDHGYSGYNYIEFDNFKELLEYYEKNTSSHHKITEIYEIARDISLLELEKQISQQKAAKTAAIQAARAKLTPEECELLGIA